MDRRSFLRSAAIMPAAIVGAASIEASSAPQGYERVSCEKGDPGERAYAIACGDGKTVKIYLDGVEQDRVITADADEGWVRRTVITPSGHVAFNTMTKTVMTEVVKGFVVIKLV